MSCFGIANYVMVKNMLTETLLAHCAFTSIRNRNIDSLLYVQKQPNMINYQKSGPIKRFPLGQHHFIN